MIEAKDTTSVPGAAVFYLETRQNASTCTRNGPKASET